VLGVMGEHKMNAEVVILSKCCQVLRLDYIYMDKCHALLHFGGRNVELRK